MITADTGDGEHTVVIDSHGRRIIGCTRKSVALGLELTPRRNGITAVRVAAHDHRYVEDHRLSDIRTQRLAGPRVVVLVYRDMRLRHEHQTQAQRKENQSKAFFHVSISLNRLQKYEKFCTYANNFVSLHAKSKFYDIFGVLDND